MKNKRMKLRKIGAAMLVGAMFVGGIGWSLESQDAFGQQQKVRINRMIEALESGKPAITGETWTFVDFEYSPYAIEKVKQVVGSIVEKKNAKGQVELAPFVRLPPDGSEVAQWMIKQVLETGAMGIIIAQVDTPQQAMRFMEGMRFPQKRDSKYQQPRGRRGSGGNSSATAWGISVKDYTEKQGDMWPLNPDGELFALPMIESPEGVKNIDSILDVPGVGGVLIGPNDLSFNYGFGYGGLGAKPAELEAAIETVAKACVAKKKYCGIVTADDPMTQKYLKLGFKIIFATHKNGSMPKY